MQDPRLGRFFTIDPLTAEYPHYSPYQFSGNRVIDCIELEGLEPEITGKETVGQTELATESGTKNVYYWNWEQDKDISNKYNWVKGDSYTHPSVKDNAEMSNDVYNIFDDDVEIGKKVANTEYTLYQKYGSEKGYKAALYRREVDGVEFFVFAVAGTDDAYDAVEDLLAGLSQNEYQVLFAINDAKRIKEWCAKRSANFSTTGHSLGGGGASAGAAATGSYACTFNAMGISSKLEDKYGIDCSGTSIDAYIMDGDALDFAQLVKANGTQHKVKPKTTNYSGQSVITISASNMIYQHSLNRFLEIYRK